jgi:small-conductance mechanosensitive channel
MRAVLLFLIALIAVAPTGPALGQTGDPGTAILDHLDHAISWYRQTASLVQSAPSPGVTVSRDDIHQQSLAVLQNAFEYARAQAAILSPADQAQSQTGGAGSSRRGLQQAYANSTQRVAAVQDQIKTLSTQIEKAAGKKRRDLTAQRDILQSELKVDRDLQSTLQKLVDFINNSGDTSGASGLMGRINDLAQTVPELRQNSPQAAVAAPAKTDDSFRPDSAGILGLGIQIFTLSRGRVQIDDQVNATTVLLDNVNRLRKPLLTRVRGLRQQVQRLSAVPDTSDSARSAETLQQLKSLGQQFAQISSIIVPLSKQALLLESTRTNLAEWSNSLRRAYMSALRYLLLRFGQIALVVMVILVLSDLWRRLTFRYVREARLRRQMLLVRRIVMGIAITLAIVLSFVSEFGSFATFAGFLTAGIAVALQNLILSVVAYFFLIGRYGVRAGDRVTMSGVTGDVVEVGLVRIYLMELTGGGSDFRPTGRIVVFSNSVLFQPSAFFKQLPGTEYAWHTVTLALAPDADLDAAETRLMGAVNQVFGKYRDVIKRQHMAFEQAVNLQVAEPVPERYVKYTEAGLEFSIRYPIEIRRAAAIDEEMMKNLLDAINKEPKIHFAGAPRIQTLG